MQRWAHCQEACHQNRIEERRAARTGGSPMGLGGWQNCSSLVPQSSQKTVSAEFSYFHFVQSLREPSNLIQLQHGPRTAGLQLTCHFRKISRLNSTDQPDDRATLVDGLFYLQGHVAYLIAMSGPFLSTAKAGSYGRGRALIFQQMPNFQERPRKAEQPNLVPRWLSTREQRTTMKTDL
jgi:hypothetical protein